MKKTGIALIGVLLLASCGGGDEATSGLPRGVTDTTITIGSHNDLSGPLAIWGVPMNNGVRMRFDELNEAGGVHGRTIEFVVEDTQYQVPLAVKAVNKLINVDEIFAMIGAMGTPMNHATFDRMFAANVPSLFPLTGARSMYEPLHPLKFAFNLSYQDQVIGGIRYMVEREGFGKICLQAPATDYGAETVEGYEQIVEELGLESVYEGRHKGSETDFVGTATVIKNSGCELLFLGTFVKDTILLYTAIREAGWDGTVVSNMVPYLPEIAIADDGGMNGMYAVAPFFVPDFENVDPDSWVGRWSASYRERFGEEPAAQAVMGYVSTDLTIIGLEKAGPDLTVENLVAGLESISNYQDPFGNLELSLTPTKHVATNYLNLYQVQDQKWVTIEEKVPF
jgi:branched-chain amino acid transport system substrate-binding protein